MSMFHHGTCASIKNVIDSFLTVNGTISLGLGEEG